MRCAPSQNAAVQTRGLQRAQDRRLVAGMFEVTWLRCIAAITVTVETSVDVDVLHCCLDGLMYGSCIAVLLGLSMERQAYSRVLAKLTFMERAVGTFSFASLLLRSASDVDTADCQRRIVEGEHLKEEWFRSLNLYAERNPPRALSIVQSTVRDTQRRVNSERRLALVRAVQGQFGHELQLTDDVHRALIKQGKLTKVSSNHGKRVAYFFFLFNDVLVYASAGLQQSTYKVHRVLHLSLCRIEDIQRGVAVAADADVANSGAPSSERGAEDSGDDSVSTTFRIVSPQKSITLCAGTADKKRLWIDALVAQMRLQLKKRHDFLSGHSQALEDAAPPHTATPQTPNDGLADVARAARPSSAPSRVLVRTASRSAESLPLGPPLAASSAGVLPSSKAEAESGSSVSDELRRYSTFIGSDWLSRQRRSPSSATPAPPFCKLCLRPFGVFRRRLTCDGCRDVVCTQCAQQRLSLPQRASPKQSAGSTEQSQSDKGRVCDACAGVLQGTVTQQSTLVTRVRA